MTRPSLWTKAWSLYSANGFRVLLKRAIRYVRRRGLTGVLLEAENSRRFQRWLNVYSPSPLALQRMAAEADELSAKPLIDVVMPVCDPALKWLESAVASVQHQCYPNWRLCIADDASTHSEVVDFLEQTAARDERVRVVRLGQRSGIAAATNAAIALGSGEYICLLDHDDELALHALQMIVEAINQHKAVDILYSDECLLGTAGEKIDPLFKPDYSPDLLLSMNYIGHLLCLRRTLLMEVGGLRPQCDGSQDYDLLLRLTEKTSEVLHIPDVLYFWRKVCGSTADSIEAKPYAETAAMAALKEACMRRSAPAEVSSVMPGRYRVRYHIRRRYLVSIVVPTKHRKGLVDACITGILERTRYPNFEIVVVDNAPEEQFTFDRRCRVVPAGDAFNWSLLNNLGAAAAQGDILLFLNDDTEVTSGDWLEELVAQASRKEVGAVGAKLFFPDGSIQHAGIVLGMGGVAGHAFYRQDDNVYSYMDLTKVVRNVSAVTGACLATRSDVFASLGGFDEHLRVSYGDVDYCLRIQQAGLWVVWTPNAVLVHKEGASRGALQPAADEQEFCRKWDVRKGDPFVNKHLDCDDPELRIRLNPQYR